MAHEGQKISNPRTGQTMRFVHIDPERLTTQTVNPPTGEFEPEHVHPRQESSARVKSGTLRFVVAGEERDVEAGEEITIPAGVPHRFASVGEEDAVAIQEFRPALRTAEFFETFFGLAHRGELDEHGMPSLLHLAVLGPAFADEIRVVRPPWAMQRALYAVLGPIARARGYQAA
jgi:mannose-6-phosphate isomerase-like protein (cupin superfamily)